MVKKHKLYGFDNHKLHNFTCIKFKNISSYNKIKNFWFDRIKDGTSVFGYRQVLKHYVFKPIMGNKKWPILGYGKRPKGAKNCGIIAQSPPVKAKSYGMPSGHASTALFFSTYLIRHLLDSNFKKNVEIIGILILSVMGLGIMYSRVYLKCHTIQQVIMGGLLGVSFGSMYYNNKDMVKKIFNL